jgi:hypothetical protein
MKKSEILLLQELRNAIMSDFEVSEYFLTLNAVGTIVQGDLTIHPWASWHSAAVNIGNIEQNVEQLADELIQQLGQDILQANAELVLAIEELRNTKPSNRRENLGKVIQELGRSLGHTANAVAVGTALIKLTQFI